LRKGDTLLSTAVPWDLVVSYLHGDPPLYSFNFSSPMTSNILPIRTTTGWGSGAFLESGFILTAAHVVRDATSIRIRVDEKWHFANITFCCPLKSGWDLALLSFSDSIAELPSGIRFSTTTPNLPSPVLVAGFGRISPTNGHEGLFTSGELSRVIHHQGQHALYITTANVYPGHSGGAVLTPDGKLLGVISNNLSHTPCVPVDTWERPFPKNGKVSVPCLNFSIPAEICKDFVNDVINGRLGRWKKTDMDLQSLWSPQDAETEQEKRKLMRKMDEIRLARLPQEVKDKLFAKL